MNLRIFRQLSFTRSRMISREMLCCALCVLALSVTHAEAEPRLPHLFSDHMVLQRDTKIEIWGWANPGEALEIILAGRSLHALAGKDARWCVSFPAHSAGGPFTLEVRGTKPLVIKDVLFGEVWVASGQSNMTFALSNAIGGAEEITKANDPSLRFFTVPRRVALQAENDTLPAVWELSSSESAKNLSAVSFFFARHLRKALGIPVGVILSAWPGTRAEEWTDLPYLQRNPTLQPIAEKWQAASADQHFFAARGRSVSLEFDDFQLIPTVSTAEPVPVNQFDKGNAISLNGGTWSYSWENAPDTVFQLISPGREGKRYAVSISGRLDGASESDWQTNLRIDGSPADLSSFAGIRFWARGKGGFVFHTLQPSIYDWDNYSTPVIQATSEWKEMNVWFKDLKQDGWGVAEKLTPNQITGFVIHCLTDLGNPERLPSELYKGMIAPLLNYRIRGVIWYQGEGNTYRAFQYRSLLPAMIHNWRDGWREGDFPFLIVQLPNQGHSEEFKDSVWAELREAQFLTAQVVPNTGLIVTIDVGESGNLHPPRKKEIGQRLALWALGTTYGNKIEFSGPLYKDMSIEGNEIRLEFQHTGSGLRMQGDFLKGFTIAGADRIFHLAVAHIQTTGVVVSSDEVPLPVAVRYAWADSPECNLYNQEGLPASPFRTDDWPGASFQNR